MSSYRIFAGATAGVSALILLLTQVVGGPDESALPELEPLPGPTLIPSLPEPSRTPPSSPTPIPEPTEELQEIGTVVYEHDFSSPENGLLAGQSSEDAGNEFGSRSAEYTDRGTLLVRSTSEIPAYVAGANTHDMVFDGRDLADLQDVSIEADAAPVDVGVGASWGLACRRDREVGRFYYAFVMDAGGHASAGIIRQDEPGGDWADVAALRSLPAGVTIGEGTTNRMRLDCLGSSITFSLDGHKVAEGSDSTYGAGSIALFVSPLAAGQEASAEAEFDNLVIREA